jgi:hypothetical protein
MYKKLILMLSFLLISFTIIKAYAAYGEFSGLDWFIEPSDTIVKVGEEFNVTFTCRSILAVHINEMSIKLYGHISENGTISELEKVFRNITLDIMEPLKHSFTIQISSMNRTVGNLWCQISVDFQDNEGHHFGDAYFEVLRIYNETPYEMSDNYHLLQSSFNTLNQVFYIVVVIAVVACALSTFYFIRKTRTMN